MNPNVNIKYFTKDNREVPPNDADVYWMELNGVFRTRRNGRPQKLVNGVWVDGN